MSLDVYRRQNIDDGYGGVISDMVNIGTVKARLSQPTAAERIEADAWQAQVDYAQLYVLPDADVFRGDELHGERGKYRVTSTIFPSVAIYKRLACEFEQYEVGQVES